MSDIIAVGKKLGVRVDIGDGEASVEGPVGAIDMFQSILAAKKHNKDDDTKVAHVEDEGEIDIFSLKITACHTATVCNLTKFSSK